MEGSPSRGQAVAALMVGSEFPGSSEGKRVTFLYMKGLHAQPVGHPDRSKGNHWYDSPEDLCLIPRLGA